ncbi:MAG: HAD-IC family P-type ATPase [Clostridia bacterium]|nr:HAD-IC family P-type ATPase [Clostridia bacterium]
MKEIEPIEAQTAQDEVAFAEDELWKKKMRRKLRRAKPPQEGTFERFEPDLDKGLTREQVKLRFGQFLFNETGKKYSKSFFSIIAGNLFTFFNLLAAIVAAFLVYSNAPISQFAFALIFAVNISVGIFQEVRAKLKIDQLNLVSSPTAKVVRYGITVQIPANEIVVDDVILLELGQQIPVDCVMCDGSVEMNESLLTGESVAVKKNAGDALYAGSFVMSGNCRARVQKVGRETYVNQLTAKAKKYKRPHSEIHNSINMFIGIIACLMLPISIFTFFINQSIPDITFNQVIQKTCAVVIGMIPSGMILLASIAMSMGIVRLAQNHTLVNDMYSLEMLARVDVLCLDKTGTITDGKMTVNDVTLLNSYTSYSLEEIMGSMLAALGDNNQTSVALYNRFGHSSALKAKTVIPFSSARKLSAVTFQGEGKFGFGAPEFVLKPMPTRVENLVQEYAQKGLRVLVLAYSSNAITDEKLPSVLRPVALITLADNVRPDAPQTIQWFKDNDVQVKVISGDNPVTVAEVAKRVGVENAEKYLSLEGLTDPEIEQAANEYTVFGRVTPEQKAVLVRALKHKGHCVAMTGDGVNDILAMKESDCAISVAAGSEAARNMSNLVLQDNNFANMPKVVYEGRQVINNVKNTSSLYIMKTLFTAIVAVICIILQHEYLFTTNNLLLFELMVAGIPSIILSLQPNTDRLQGKYFSYVLCHSIPAAMTLAFSVMTMYVASMIQYQDFVPEYQALAVMALTFTGVAMLYRQCLPFNLLRAITFAVSAVACVTVFCIPYTAAILYTDWMTVQFSATGILLLLCLIQFAIPLSKWLLVMFTAIQKALDKNS